MPEQKNDELDKEKKNIEEQKTNFFAAQNDLNDLGENKNTSTIISRKNTDYKYTKMSNFVLKLSRFYAPMPLWKLGLLVCGLAIVFGIISVFFVKNPGIYNFGLAAFGQAIARLTNVLLRDNPKITPTIYNLIDNALFWILYLVLSIPIFIFGWKKVGKSFTLLTLEFLVVSSLVSFAIGQIPGADKLYIIGSFDHSNVHSELKDYVATNNWQGKSQLWGLIPLEWSEGGNALAQIIFAVAYGFMLAFFFAIVAIMGGSAGVTGIIGEYISVEKHINFGKINGYMNIVIIIISVLVGTYIPGSILLQDMKGISADIVHNQKDYINYSIANSLAILQPLAWKPALYFSPNFISTLVCNFVFVAYLNKLFPRHKLVQIKVYSPHISHIRESLLKDTRVLNTFTIQEGIGGFTGNKTKVLSSITLYRLVPHFIKKIRQVDQNALITISNVASVDGSIYLPASKF